MSTPLRIAISPCPNDTFVFHGLLAGTVEVEDRPVAIELADVETLNERFARGAFDAAKTSFAAALGFDDLAVVLPVGAALGFGVGPLVLRSPRARRSSGNAIASDARVLSPGAGTTAHLLWRMLHPGEGRVEHVAFSRILPALARGEADYGICIHEARFTYRDHGLELVEDLGDSYERATGAALPLGGILARRDLGDAALDALTHAISRSLEHARANRAAALATMREHARELDDDVLWSHVDLYVNDATRDLGPEGRRALATFASFAAERGVVPRGSLALEVHAPRAPARRAPPDQSQ